MADKHKARTKKDLEKKIAALEAKLNKLSSQLTKPAEPKPQAKPAEAKPQAKPAEAKPQAKPAETKPQAKTNEKPQPPATLQEALENAYRTAPTSDFHQYRAKVTGYSPAPNRYFVRSTAPVGKVPTTNWNDQKANVTGYTQPSNQYFATRQRLAYHPADKTFGSFSGVEMSVDGVVLQRAEPPKQADKQLEVAQTNAESSSQGNEKSKKQQLEDYETNYLQRLEQQKIDDELEYQKALAEETQTRTKQTHGALPKGFESKPEPNVQQTSKGTLPKGF